MKLGQVHKKNKWVRLDHTSEGPIKEGKVEDTKERMGYRKHNFSESAKDMILTMCLMTDLREKEIEEEVENILPDCFYFLCKVKGKATPECEKREGIDELEV